MRVLLDLTKAYGLTFIFPEGDTAIGASLRQFGEFARAESDLICDYLERSTGGLVDVGANIGSVCLPVAKRYPDRPVTAVEAHRGLAQILSANAFGNHLLNVSVVNAAGGAERGVVDFPNPPLSTPGNFGTSTLARGHAPGAQPTLQLRLDDLAPADTAFIKVDVEGFEAEVLKGARRTLEEVRPVWLIEASHVDKAAGRATIATMRAAGYRTHWMFSPFVTSNHSKRTGTTEPTVGDYSVLCLPPGVPNLWDLPEVEATPEWPERYSVFPYFKRYGR